MLPTTAAACSTSFSVVPQAGRRAHPAALAGWSGTRSTETRAHPAGTESPDPRQLSRRQPAPPGIPREIAGCPLRMLEQLAFQRRDVRALACNRLRRNAHRRTPRPTAAPARIPASAPFPHNPAPSARPSPCPAPFRHHARAAAVPSAIIAPSRCRLVTALSGSSQCASSTTKRHRPPHGSPAGTPPPSPPIVRSRRSHPSSRLHSCLFGTSSPSSAESGRQGAAALGLADRKLILPPWPGGSAAPSSAHQPEQPCISNSLTTP